jgi:hypothetical protein
VRHRLPSVAACLLLLGACSRVEAPAGHDAGAAATAGAPLGEIMVGVGRRFETAGRASLASRFELAAFEVGEIEETFEDAIPRAAPPKEGPTAHLPAQAADFLRVSLPPLKAAAASRDAAAFARAFQAASAACNACHAASAKPFIEVPSAPGKSVPDTDPAPAPRPPLHVP